MLSSPTKSMRSANKAPQGLFYKPCTLARLMAEFGPQDFHKLERFLKHARIKKMHMSTTNEAGQPIAPMRTVFGLASPQDGRLTDRTTPGRAPEVAAFGANSRNVKFWLEEGREYITVYDYFKGSSCVCAAFSVSQY